MSALTTVAIESRLFEVPAGLIGRIVQLHWHPQVPDEVEVLFESKSCGKAVLVNTAVNMKIGRASFKRRADDVASDPVPPPPLRSGELFGHRLRASLGKADELS